MRQKGDTAVTVRQINRHCGPFHDATRARIKILPLEQIEALAGALLDSQGLPDLEAWLDRNV